MTSSEKQKSREHYNPDGFEKHSFMSRHEAKIRARVIGGMKPYKCSVCKKYHLATKK